MPYVERRSGVVSGVYANPQPGYAEEWLEDGDEEVVAYRNPPVFQPLPRSAFLFMMHKIGVTEAQVEALIDKMPDGDEKTLALIVFRNQQTFRRDNSLLQTLTAAAGLSVEQVDSAWLQAEQVTW